MLKLPASRSCNSNTEGALKDGEVLGETREWVDISVFDYDYPTNSA
jgi:hypothetical protein